MLNRRPKNDQLDAQEVERKMIRAGRRGNVEPSRRGYKSPGGGYSSYVDMAPEHRGSSRQVCGLWPFASGAGSPLDGVPLGNNLLTGNIVGLDHFTAYERGRIPTPSAYFMSNPALGKSTLVGKIMMGLDFYGVKSMVLGDVKGEHVARTLRVGGKRIPLGNGRGYLGWLVKKSNIRRQRDSPPEMISHRPAIWGGLWKSRISDVSAIFCEKRAAVDRQSVPFEALGPIFAGIGIAKPGGQPDAAQVESRIFDEFTVAPSWTLSQTLT